MTPEVQQAVSDEILLDEEERLFVYDDATSKPIVKGTTVIGNPTIAIGRNIAARGISHLEARYLLADDLVAAEADLATLLPWLPTLSPKRQAAVYSLYFNTALGNPNHFVGPHGWPTFLGQMRTGQYEAASNNLKTSQPWATQVGKRSGRLADMVLHG